MAPAESASQTRRSRNSNGYKVTIVYNVKQYISASELYLKLAELKVQLSKYGCEWSSIVGIELKDTTNVLHLHTYVTCLRSPWVKPCKGWNIQVAQLTYDPQIWLSYCEKYSQKKPAIEQREWLSKYYLTANASNNYGFIECT